MPLRRTATVLLILWICATGAFARTASAEPLSFGNVSAFDPDFTLVGLFDNAGRVFTLKNDVLTFAIDLDGTLEPGQTDVLRLTFLTEGGQTEVREFGIPVFGTTPPPLTLLFSQTFPTSYTPLAHQLTVDLVNTAPDFVIPSGANAGTLVDSFTFSFSTATPVPEPGTWLLIGSGLTWLLRRRRTQ